MPIPSVLWAASDKNQQPWCQLAKTHCFIKGIASNQWFAFHCHEYSYHGFYGFQKLCSVLPMFLTAEIGNVISQCTHVGCVLLQLMLCMQTAARAWSDCETTLSSSTCACCRTLERSLLLPFLSFQTLLLSYVLGLWKNLIFHFSLSQRSL